MLSSKEENVDDIVWHAYEKQSSMGHDVVVILSDTERVYALGSIIASRAPGLIELMNEEISPKEIDLSTSKISGQALKGVLDHIHGAHDKSPPRLRLARDFIALCALLQAADFCGAEKCKAWVEKAIIDDHVSSLKAQDLRRLTEDARAQHADRLFKAAGKELLERAPVEILRGASSDILAEIVDSHVPKRARRNQELAVATAAGRIMIYDAATGSSIRNVVGHSSRVRCVTYSSDGSVIASSSDDKSIRVWNSDTYECKHVIKDAHTATIHQVAFSKLGNIVLASASDDFSCKLWNLTDGSLLKKLELEADNGVNSIAFSRINELELATGDDFCEVKVWNIESSEFKVLEGHDDAILCIAYGRDNLLASASYDETIKLWDTQSKECLRTFEGHKNAVFSLSFSPDNTTLASISSHGSCRIWNIVRGTCVRELRDQDLKLIKTRCIAYDSDGSTLASCTYIEVDHSYSFKIWDPNTGRCTRTISTGFDEVPFIAFRPP